MSEVGWSMLPPEDKAQRGPFIVPWYFYNVPVRKGRKGGAMGLLCWTVTGIQSPACLSHAHTWPSHPRANSPAR